MPRLGDSTPSDSRSWVTKFDDNDLAHVLPSFGPKHELSHRCWCHPVLDCDYTEPAMSHNVAQ